MKRSVRSLLALAIVASLSVVTAQAQNARVRVVHASPDAPAVDVLVNNSLRLFQNAEFEDVTQYQSVPAGVYNVKVVPAGGGAGSAAINADLNLQYYKDYTVVAVNRLSSIEPIVLEDDNGLLANAAIPGSARVRFLHASANAPAVDIKVVGGPYLFQNIPFKGVGNYINVPAGRVDLEVRVAGTDNVVLTVPGLQLKLGATYTVFATGLVGESPTLNAIAAEDSRGPFVIRPGRFGR